MVAVSCSRQPIPLVERVAVLRFDNLTGDQSLDWIATAAPAILSAEWNGASRKLALLAGTVRDGYLEGATRLTHGYFEKRGGKLQFHIVMEDASLHKTTADTTAEGDPLTAMNSLARRIEPAANSFSTTNAEAIEAWGHGNFERAVSIDPDFSGAWLAWVETLVASGDSQRAVDVGSKALMRSSLRSPVDRARIELSVAGIRHDQSASIMALEKLAQLAPFDSGALRRLAEANFAARRFQEAERTYRDLIRIEPANAASLNALGYVLALAGEPEKARTEFEEYGKRSGQAVNALDSIGEGMFLNGKFQEAEKAFLGSYQKDPTFFDGAALWKAAHARWLGGDLRGAEALIEQYTEARTKAHDPLTAWRRAVWLYETGRREQAVGLLSQPNSQAPDAAPVVAMMQQQLAVWRDPRTALGAASVEQLKQLYERTEPVNDGLVRTLYAAALLGSGSNEDAGRKDDARKLLAVWPLPPRMSSPLESLVYPQFLDLRKKLG
jgi:Flp pilus assembly protein TadD